MARASGRHAVHVSSVAVYGQTSGRMDAAGPLKGTIRPDNFYGRSKRLAEEAATAMHDSGRLQVTIVRPSAVYGERDRLFAPTLGPGTPPSGCAGDGPWRQYGTGGVRWKRGGRCGLGVGREGVWERLQLGRGLPSDPARASRGTRPGAQPLADAGLLAGSSRAGRSPVGRRCPFHGTRAPRAVWSEGSAPRIQREPVFVRAGTGSARLATLRTTRVGIAQNGAVATRPSGQRGN